MAVRLSIDIFEEVKQMSGVFLRFFGGRRFGTPAEPVNGGYLVNGRKFFVSSSGAADYFATPALLMADGAWVDRTLYFRSLEKRRV